MRTKEQIREYNRNYMREWSRRHPRKRKPLTPAQQDNKRLYMREWIARHPGYRAAQSRKHYAAHPEKKKEYYTKNKERISARDKRRRLNNIDKFRALIRKASEKMRRENPEKVRLAIKKWKVRNREHCREVDRIWRLKNLARFRVKQVDKSHRRRARERASGHEDCREKINALHRERFCRYCCTPLTDDNFTVDHIVPLVRGGHHKPDNLAAACDFCNSSKGTKLLREWTWKEAA